MQASLSPTTREESRRQVAPSAWPCFNRVARPAFTADPLRTSPLRGPVVPAAPAAQSASSFSAPPASCDARLSNPFFCLRVQFRPAFPSRPTFQPALPSAVPPARWLPRSQLQLGRSDSTARLDRDLPSSDLARATPLGQAPRRRQETPSWSPPPRRI